MAVTAHAVQRFLSRIAKVGPVEAERILENVVRGHKPSPVPRHLHVRSGKYKFIAVVQDGTVITCYRWEKKQRRPWWR